MKFKIPTHHKLFGAAATPFVVDKGFDLGREHLFLAAHEALSHAKLLGYSIGGVVALGALAFVIRVAKASKPAAAEAANVLRHVEKITDDEAHLALDRVLAEIHSRHREARP